MPAGRPKVITEKVRKEILDRVSCGQTVRAICRDAHMPSHNPVYMLLGSDKEFYDDYARAKIIGMEAMNDELFEISDDGSNDWMTRRGIKVVDREAVERSKLRVDTRKWSMAKLLPTRYGDALKVSTVDGTPPKIIDGMTLKERFELDREIVVVDEPGPQIL